MADRVRWLLVGAGIIAGKRVAPAIAQAHNSELLGVCDVVPENAEKIAEEHKASEVFTDLGRAIADTKAEAVYVATPVFLHVPTAVKALEAGKHVLVEKPLGLSADDTERLLQVADRHRELKAGCAYYRRFYPAYDHARGMIEAGEFGDISLVRMHYYSWGRFASHDWRAVKAKSGGGPLSDMGSHMFDVMIGLLGMPESVYAKVQTKTHDYEVEDSAVVVMRLADGGDVVASFHWNSKTWTHEFEIVGTEARVKWHPYDSGKVVKTVGRDIEELDLPNADNVHLPLVQNFVDAVVDDKEPLIGLEEASKTNIVIDAVYRSAQAGTEIIL